MITCFLCVGNEGVRLTNSVVYGPRKFTWSRLRLHSHGIVSLMVNDGAGSGGQRMPGRWPKNQRYTSKVRGNHSQVGVCLSRLARNSRFHLEVCLSVCLFGGSCSMLCSSMLTPHGRPIGDPAKRLICPWYSSSDGPPFCPSVMVTGAGTKNIVPSNGRNP